MSFLKELGNQLATIWNRWSQPQRIGMIAAVSVLIAGVVGVGYWAMTPEYVVLADHLSPSQTAAFVNSLEAENISYKFNFSGSSILVSRSELSQARMSASDLIETSDSEMESLDSFWDPTVKQERMARQHETRIARTLEQQRGINKATVHITPSKDSPFVRDLAPAKASVTLDLKRGVPFSGGDASAIVSMVAHSVENLLPENVTVLSTDGRLLSSPAGIEADVSGQLEFRTMLESNLAAKAENLLIPLLGIGNATVRVTADVDFTETERTQKTIDPESKAKISEELRTESVTGANKVALGPPGTSSNLNVGTDAFAPAESGSQEKEEINTTYQYDQTTNLVREAPGKIQRLTVAAVVQLPTDSVEPADSAALGNVATTQTAAITSEQIEKIIRNAVGFDEARGDDIQVVVGTMAGVPDLSPPIGFLDNLDQYVPLVRAASLGMAALSALIFGTIALRKFQPVVIQSAPENSLSPEAVERLNTLSAQMQEHPEAVTTVLATWLDQKEAENPTQRRAA